MQRATHRRRSPWRSSPSRLALGAGLRPAAGAGRRSATRELSSGRASSQPGQTVEIKGVNGAIHAEPSPSGQVEVSAVKTGRRSDPRGCRASRSCPHADGVTICAVYPNVDDEPNDARRAVRGHMNTRNNDVKVEFTVRVPAGANFDRPHRQRRHRCARPRRPRRHRHGQRLRRVQHAGHGHGEDGQRLDHRQARPC